MGAENAIESELRTTPGEFPLAIALEADMTGPTNGGYGPELSGENSAIYWVNLYRERAGLFPLEHNTSLEKAARGHATYLARHQSLYTNGLSVHREEKGHEGFLAEMYWQRQALFEYEELPLSEVIAFQRSTEAAIAQWMESVYHRIPLLDTRAISAAYSLQVSENRAFGVMEIAQPDLGPEGEDWADNNWVAYPANGASLVPTEWDGKESPQPMAPPSGFPSGPVFTLTNAGAELVRVAKSILEDEDGNVIAHTLLDAKNDAFFTHQSGLALYANDPLEPGKEYTVRIQGFRGAEAFDWNSRFTTTPKSGCSLLGQEACGEGKGCYPNANGALCAWKGVVPEGGSCTYQNECIPGTSCVEGTCRKLCDLEAGNWFSCDSVCSERSYSKLSGEDSVGVCQSPVCTPHHDQCGNGTSCQVSSTFSCQRPGPSAAGEGCDAPGDCAGGLACVANSTSGISTCQVLCVATDAEGWKESELPLCGERCNGNAQFIPQHPGLGTCAE